MSSYDPSGLDQLFAKPLVRQELWAYRASGLNKRQRELVALLELSECLCLTSLGGTATRRPSPISTGEPFHQTSQ